MRITGGSFCSRKLEAPAGGRTRPTSDRVRESLFAVLGNLLDFDGAHVVDAFAGTGSLGLEALSRGAASATFLEQSRDALRCVEANIRSLGVDARTRVVAGDAERGVARITQPVRVAFADPPYALVGTAAFRRFLEAMRAAVPWEAGAFVVVEHRTGSPPPAVPGLESIDARSWGDTGVAFARIVDPPPKS